MGDSINRRQASGLLLSASWAGLGLTGAAGAVAAPVQTAAAARAAGVASAPGFILAGEAPPDLDPRGWLVSEKYDGVRALWTGSQLLSRSGRPLPAPPGFLARLPAAPLDGELWLGRGRFEAMVALVQRRGGTDADWSAVRYQVFERPGGEGDFATRAALLAGLCPGEGPAQAVTQSRLGDRQALRERLAAVLAQGGEGLVLHRADSPWHTGRSPDLLKLKPVHDDEAEVIGHEAGHGRLQGLCGALLVRDGAGRVFRLGSGLSDAQRRAPPALGSTVSFRHRGRTGRGWPRQPTFWRLAERPAADIVRA